MSAGQAGDAPEGRKLLTSLSLSADYVIMDKAYEGDETRQTVRDLGLTPVVPPKRNRVDPWEYDRERYKQRNEVERLFRRLKGFRRVFTRFDKLDVVYTFFVYFALIVDALNSVNTPWYQRALQTQGIPGLEVVQIQIRLSLTWPSQNQNSFVICMLNSPCK